MVRPLAYRDSTTSSTPGSRRCRFLTTTGSNEPSRSRGTSILTGPTESVTTVLAVVPLRVFAALPSLDFLCLARPRCSVISSSRAVSSTLLVNCLSSPSGPVRSSPFSLAMRTNVSAASCSALRFSASGFFVGVMFPIVPADIVHQPFRPATRPAS